MKFQPVAAAAVLLFSSFLHAQTTAFSYQGQLNSNSVPANGLYDFRFRLFDVSSNAVAGPVTNAPVGVTNGLFTTTLDFGSAVFDGSDRWLEVAVRNNGSAVAYTKLSPLQPITSTPYAIRALSASSAIVLTAPLQGSNVVGTIRATNLPPNVAFLTSNQVFTATNIFNGVVTANNGANSFSGSFNGTFAGNGSALTSLTATNLTGTVADARLSTNVALQSDPALVFAGNVTASNFTGAGHGLTNVPGAFFWVVPTNGQIYPNVGYICTNEIVPVTLTLPAVPAIGDTYKICAAGAGGWVIGQNAGQTILAGNLSRTVGQNWDAFGPKTNWVAIASSADGTKLAAAVNPGNIYTSTDSGATWTQRTGSLRTNWSAIASSADGTKLVAVVGYSTYNAAGKGSIYRSTDSGANWGLSFGSSSNWSAVASSADGTKLAAVARGGPIELSSNSGGSWVPVSGSPGFLWSGVAMSADGTKMVAIEANGAIFTTTNSGLGWLAYTNVTPAQPAAVAMSADGSRAVVTANGGQLYLSTDSGVTWITGVPPTSGRLAAVASSADGNRLATAVGDAVTSGAIYGSSDSGATWPKFIGPPDASWSGMASSADGSLLAATAFGGNIYVSSQSRTTAGTNGYVVGSQHSAIELIYVGNGNFLPLNHEGTIRAY